MLTVYVVDDEPMAIKYFAYLLDAAGVDAQIVGTSTNSLQALSEIRALEPDIVFTDIVMPVMSGVELAEKILQTMSPQIYLLSSYQDFAYARKGLQIGATDYLLKNDLDEKLLREVFRKAGKEIETGRRVSHVILEHNIRDFLLSDSSIPEDLAYLNKPLQRYAVLNFQPLQPIVLSGTSSAKRRMRDVRINCAAAEKLAWPNGLKCSAFVEMPDETYTAVFFINATVSESGRLLYKAADLLLRLLKEDGQPWRCLAGETQRHFFDLPPDYRHLQQLREYLYICPDREISFTADLEKGERRPVDITLQIERIHTSLLHLQREAVERTEKLFEECRSSLTVTAYTDMMKDLYKMLRTVAVSCGLDDGLLIMLDEYDNYVNAERGMLNCVEMVLQSLEQKQDQQYSKHIRLAVRYIQDNYSRDISVADIAASAGVSEGHLRRLFKKELNTGVVEYLTDHRLDCAKRLLGKGSENISSVWQKTGFTSAQYFSYVFKKREGILPREYVKSGAAEE